MKLAPERITPHLPGKQTIYVATPIKYKGDEYECVRRFRQNLLYMNKVESCREYYVFREIYGINAPYATSELAADFVENSTADWFFLTAADLVTTPEDIHRLLMAAQSHKADVVGGLVSTHPCPEDKSGEAGHIIAGSFEPDGENFRWWRRGIEIDDLDVLSGKVVELDLVGGGCALFSRRALESLRPDKNRGLAYWCYDKQKPAYDVRIFQRLQKKGFKAIQHCGVVMGHVAKDKDGLEKPYTYWDLPRIKVVDEVFNKIKPKVEETLYAEAERA